MNKKKCTPLDEKPLLYRDLNPIWDAFWRLHKTRDSGLNGPSAIKLTEMEAYLHIFKGFKPEEFIDTIGVMDDKFLNWLNEREEKRESEESKNKIRKAM